MSYLEVTGNTIRQPSVAALTCDFDVARTLVSAAPRLISAPNFLRVPVTGYTIREPSVAGLASDFRSWARLCPPNAGMPPGDKLKHVPRRSHRSYNLA